ncbi:autotransporter outer membrane beta-barrel domain-containing protein [Enterobacter ludwigii]
MTRLGMKAYVNGHNTIDEGKDCTFQPFIEVNWIHNSRITAVKMDDTRDRMRGTKNIGELKMGIEGQLNQDLSVWGNIAQQVGNNSFSDMQGMAGVKYSF